MLRRRDDAGDQVGVEPSRMAPAYGSHCRKDNMGRSVEPPVPSVKSVSAQGLVRPVGLSVEVAKAGGRSHFHDRAPCRQASKAPIADEGTELEIVQLLW